MSVVTFSLLEVNHECKKDSRGFTLPDESLSVDYCIIMTTTKKESGYQKSFPLTSSRSLMTSPVLEELTPVTTFFYRSTTTKVYQKCDALGWIYKKDKSKLILIGWMNQTHHGNKGELVCSYFPLWRMNGSYYYFSEDTTAPVLIPTKVPIHHCHRGESNCVLLQCVDQTAMIFHLKEQNCVDVIDLRNNERILLDKIVVRVDHKGKIDSYWYQSPIGSGSGSGSESDNILLTNHIEEFYQDLIHAKEKSELSSGMDHLLHVNETSLVQHPAGDHLHVNETSPVQHPAGFNTVGIYMDQIPSLHQTILSRYLPNQLTPDRILLDFIADNSNTLENGAIWVTLNLHHPYRVYLGVWDSNECVLNDTKSEYRSVSLSSQTSGYPFILCKTPVSSIEWEDIHTRRVILVHDKGGKTSRIQLKLTYSFSYEYDDGGLI